VPRITSVNTLLQCWRSVPFVIDVRRSVNTFAIRVSGRKASQPVRIHLTFKLLIPSSALRWPATPAKSRSNLFRTDRSDRRGTLESIAAGITRHHKLLQHISVCEFNASVTYEIDRNIGCKVIYEGH
jgi:hypothetical protein